MIIFNSDKNLLKMSTLKLLTSQIRPVSSLKYSLNSKPLSIRIFYRFLFHIL